MNQKRKAIPMHVPAIGGAPNQAPFDISQAQPKMCLGCQSEFFDLVYKVGKISSMAPGNKTGKDVTVKYEVFICLECGLEIDKEPKVKQ